MIKSTTGKGGLRQLLAFVLLVAGAVYLWQNQPELVQSLIQRGKEVMASEEVRSTFHRAIARSKSGESQKATIAQIYYLQIVEGKQRLVGVEREVAAVQPARDALEQLATASPPEGYKGPLPAGTKLKAVRVEKGVATADFSRALTANFDGGSDNEYIVVYSIVNTLVSLPGVEKAQILIEGEPVDSIGGHLDCSKPLPYDAELVVSAKQ